MHIRTQIMDFLYKRFGLFYQPIRQVKLLDKTFQVIQGSIHETPDYDDAWLLALAYHSKYIFDIGCNIGQASMILLYPECVQRIVLVDPNPKALAIAAENMILNHLSHKTHFVCAFAAEQTGENILFFTVGAGAAGSMYSSHAKTASDMGLSHSVPTISVDWLSEWYKLSPDLVKIDVEGAEIKVLQGAVNLAEKQKTKFFVEMHSNTELSMKNNAENVLKWCEDNQYAAWYLKEKSLLNSPLAIEHRGRCHLLLLPKGEILPGYLHSIEQSASLQDTIKTIQETDTLNT